MMLSCFGALLIGTIYFKLVMECFYNENCQTLKDLFFIVDYVHLNYNNISGKNLGALYYKGQKNSLKQFQDLNLKIE